MIFVSYSKGSLYREVAVLANFYAKCQWLELRKWTILKALVTGLDLKNVQK
jgi:hypothetical protein